MRISDWSSDVCSSDLPESLATSGAPLRMASPLPAASAHLGRKVLMVGNLFGRELGDEFYMILPKLLHGFIRLGCNVQVFNDREVRSEEHTSELQSLMRTSYAVFCLKKKKKQITTQITC